MVYKKQVIAGDIPEVRPYDTTKMFRTISETANGIANATAKLAEQNFMNRFDIEQRKQLNECYERNLNNPKQLEIEQQKIKLNLVKALPNSKMRNEAMARFEMHAMPYMQKAKENLYKQTFNEAQASTIEMVDLKINDMREKAADLYSPDLAVAGTSINALGLDIAELGDLVSRKDERGNSYFTPAQIAASKREIRQIMTAGAVPYFESLDAQGMRDFYKQYKEKTVEMNFANQDDPSGFVKQKMNEHNTDWEVYEKNLAYMGKVIDEMDKQEKKGKAENDALQYSINKIGVKMRLDLNWEKIKNETKTDPYKVLSFLNEIDDLTTNKNNAYKGQDGQISFYLKPEEAYQYQKEILPYWEDVMKELNDPNKKTTFGYGLDALKVKYDNIAKEHGLNEYDYIDLVQGYYRQLKTTGVSMDDGISRGSVLPSLDSVKNSFTEFVMKSTKISQKAKNKILSTPDTIKTLDISDKFIVKPSYSYTTNTRGTISGIGNFNTELYAKK